MRKVVNFVFWMLLINFTVEGKTMKYDVKKDYDAVKALSKLEVVDYKVDISKLNDIDKKVIAHLIKASQVIDKIFSLQVSNLNDKILSDLKKSKSPKKNDFIKLFGINRGPWDRLNEDASFIEGIDKKPFGANFYDEGITKESLLSFIEKNPDDKKQFESNFTVIKKDDEGNLYYVPYNVEYKDLLKEAYNELKTAAKLTTNDSLKKYLNSRAQSFLSNDYQRSDYDWIDLNGNIEVVIGPYEVYEDEMNYKASYEAFIGIVDQVVTDELSILNKYIADFQSNLPIKKFHERKTFSPLKAVELLYSAGDGHRSVATLAFNLPNDEEVRNKKGSKNVLLINTNKEKFNKICKPIAQIIIDEKLQSYLSEENFISLTINHEFSHILGPGYIDKKDKKGNLIPVDIALKSESGSISSKLEEGKADILGLLNAQYIVTNKLIPTKYTDEYMKKSYVTYLASMFRSYRWGFKGAHVSGCLINLNYFIEQGAVTYSSQTSKFSVDFKKIPKAVRDLAQKYLEIQKYGNVKAGIELIEKYGKPTKEIEEMLTKLTHIPSDIYPNYVTAEELVKKYGK